MKFKLQINNYNTDETFSPTELNILLNMYEERLEITIQNNELKRCCNADLTLENTADLIEQKRKEDLEAVVYTIIDRFGNNGKGKKKFKCDTSDDDKEKDYIEQ
jgi:hypothetical protein